MHAADAYFGIGATSVYYTGRCFFASYLYVQQLSLCETLASAEDKLMKDMSEIHVIGSAPMRCAHPSF
jgi:hypothetical protein